MLCIKSHNPHSSPYPATASQQFTACSLSLSLLHLGPPRSMPCCHAASVMSCHTQLRHATKVSNRPILHWPLTHYYTACMLHAKFMHYTESDDQKLGGTIGPIHCWSPQPKSWGGLVSPSPHGCCAYVAIWQIYHHMQVGNLLHKWNVENDQACNKLPASFQLVRLVGCGLKQSLQSVSGRSGFGCTGWQSGI